jgi:putative sigma-54 modulation protein
MSRKSKAAEFAQSVNAYNLSITGRNVEVTEALSAYVNEKIAKVERISNRITDLIVTMDVQKLIQRVDLYLKTGNLAFKSHAETDNMYASIDKAFDKLEAQLLRYKTKVQDHHLRATKDVDLQVNVLQPFPDQEVMDVNDEIEDENMTRMLDRFKPHQIIKKGVCTLKTLTDGEAMAKMDLSGDRFMIYIGEDSHKLKVIYPLQDGNYGVVESASSAHLPD